MFGSATADDGSGEGGIFVPATAGIRLGKAPTGQSRGKSGVVEQQAMRNGQQHHHHNKRMRGRNNQQHNNNRRNHNPLTRVYESNGPDVKIRGTANHVAEKYLQLARDAQSSGDPVSAENYFQHAEHYYRLIAAAQAQFQQAYGGPPRPYEEASEDGGDGDEETQG